MCPPEHTRRQWLGTLTAVGATGFLAGCSALPGSDSEGSEATRVDLIPDGPVAAVHADVSGLLSDSTVRETASDLLGEFGGASSVESALDQAEQQVGLDPRGLDEILMLTWEDPRQVAAITWADWSLEEVRTVAEQGSGSLTEDSYSGTTVYRSDSVGDSMLAELDEGVFAVGRASGVEPVIDVWNGDADPAGGDLRDAYTAATGGYVRFGFDVPTEQIPEQAGGQLDFSVFRQVTYAYGSVTEESKDFLLSFETDGESAGTELAEMLRGVKSLAETQLAEGNVGQSERERFRRLLENTTVEQDGQTVTVQNTDGVEAVVVALGALLGSFVLGVGSQSPDVPQVAFEFEYDSEQGDLTITHTGGDHVAARELFVRGEGVPTGSWVELGGSTNDSVDGEPAVVAGDSLTLTDVGPAHEVSVVWESTDGDTSATLAEFDGPEA